MNVTDRLNGDKCYGCRACENICPTNAILVTENQYGFLNATVNSSSCINCEKCLEVCPRLNVSYDDNDLPRSFAIWAKDEIRMKSASGGVFSAIAEDFINIQGGGVAGAIWSDNYNVKHIYTENFEDIKKIQNSKYVQSSTEKTYVEVKNALQQNKKVLYSGCPCQIAGLYRFLGGKDDNLYTIDLICHGVPSSSMLRKYINDEYGNKEIDKIDFRDKSVFGWSTEMNIYFKDNTELHKRATEDSFFQAFLSNMSLNPTCEFCQFSKVPRQGDISIGDFWNIERYDRQLNDRKGTSLVLVNNDKGKAMLEKCDSIVLCEEIPLEFLKSTCNKTVFMPFSHHYGSRRFLKEYQINDFSKAVNQCRNFHYDIGLVTTWFARNFGAIFTAYALYKYLEKNHYSVLMINKPTELWGNKYNSVEKSSIAMDFGRRNYNVSKEYSLEDNPYIGMLCKSCDTFVVGSDQLWNPKVYAYKYYFFLDFVDSENKKIAYSTSVGATNFEGTKQDKHYCDYFLKRFDRISNRENEAVEMLNNEFGIKSTKVIDPVFLLEKADYQKLAEKSTVIEEKPFLFVYILDGNYHKKEYIDAVSEKLKLRVICAYDIERPEASKRYLQYEEAKIHTPEDWLWYIENAKFIMTDSYHGGCLSVIFNKEFMCFINPLRGENRFKELFGQLQLENRLISQDMKLDDMVKFIKKKINYSKVNSLIENERQRSSEWLFEALKIPPKTMDVEEFVISKINKNNMLQERQRLLYFKNISQLNCKKGVSVQEIIEAMPENSYLQQVQGNYDPVCDTPVPYGILTIKKTTSYFVEIQFVQMSIPNEKPQLYIGNYVKQKLLSWEKFISESEFDSRIKYIEKEIESLNNKINEKDSSAE